MRTRPGICQRKKRFADEASALEAAERAHVVLRPYHCALCRQYHLTSRTKGMKTPRFVLDHQSAHPAGRSRAAIAPDGTPPLKES